MIHRFQFKFLALLTVTLLSFTACETTSSYKPAAVPLETTSFIETQDGIDDFGACDEDAHNYCDGFYSGDWESFAEENDYTTASWKYSLLDCLEDHRDETSEACDDSLERREELNEAMNTACAKDRGSYCKGVVPVPGSEPQVDCLMENYEKLSIECSEALDAHEAAKPEDL